jgi:hypothetical protein
LRCSVPAERPAQPANAAGLLPKKIDLRLHCPGAARPRCHHVAHPQVDLGGKPPRARSNFGGGGKASCFNPSIKAQSGPCQSAASLPRSEGAGRFRKRGMLPRALLWMLPRALLSCPRMQRSALRDLYVDVSAVALFRSTARSPSERASSTKGASMRTNTQGVRSKNQPHDVSEFSVREAGYFRWLPSLIDRFNSASLRRCKIL